MAELPLGLSIEGRAPGVWVAAAPRVWVAAAPRVWLRLVGSSGSVEQGS